MKESRILIVDDEPLMRISISDALKEEGYRVDEVGIGAEGVKLLGEGSYDVLLTDLKLPDTTGIEVLKSSRKVSSDTAVILITAFGTVDTAVEAMKLGAYDYITKPFRMDELLIMVKRIFRMKEMELENRMLKEEVERRYDFSGILTRSDAMKEVLENIKFIAVTDSTVLVLGESGTGKELVANALHYNSARKDKPFIKISCAALPETLLEAELFGYERGAFTGAVKTKKGKFELADGGTIFLDEIGELTPGIQAKLLRVLQEKEFDRLGGTETMKVDVRIICATQRDLKAEVQRGGFREDLYYRLNVVPVSLPPLRERRGDILLLANHFLRHFIEEYKKPAKKLSPEACECLIRYPFPGNVRELENAVERAVVLARGEDIEQGDLPEEVRKCRAEATLKARNDGFGNLSEAIREFEKDYIVRVLEETKGNKSLAAKLLGVSRKTLWEKCKHLDII